MRTLFPSPFPSFKGETPLLNVSMVIFFFLLMPRRSVLPSHHLHLFFCRWTIYFFILPLRVVYTWNSKSKNNSRQHSTEKAKSKTNGISFERRKKQSNKLKNWVFRQISTYGCCVRSHTGGLAIVTEKSFEALNEKHSCFAVKKPILLEEKNPFLIRQ